MGARHPNIVNTTGLFKDEIPDGPYLASPGTKMIMTAASVDKLVKVYNTMVSSQYFRR